MEEQDRKPPEWGDRTREELAACFGQMYAGWDDGVNLTQPKPGQFHRAPMTPLELEARYVAAEVGLNIYELANTAAFAPILVYEAIRKYLGPLFEWQAIETAPQDGRWLIGRAEKGGNVYRISWGRNHDDRLAWCTTSFSFMPGYITHWMHCPASLAVSAD